jgi:hypothetical protein
LSNGETAEPQERGPKAPGHGLGKAVALLRDVVQGVGYGAANREVVAKSLGYTSLNGKSNRAIAALIHFGLLEKSGNAAVRISDLGKQILMPKDEREARSALVQAARNPSLYQRLFERFSGHGLPALLPNILVREYGVLPSSSDAAARTFRETVEYAGLLRNGVLHQDLDEPAQPVEPEEVEDEDEGEGETEGVLPRDTPPSGSAVEQIPRVVPHTAAIARAPVPDGTQRYTIPLDMHGRLATIDIPLPVAPSDMSRIKRWAEFMAELSNEQTPNISGN